MHAMVPGMVGDQVDAPCAWDASVSFVTARPCLLGPLSDAIILVARSTHTHAATNAARLAGDRGSSAAVWPKPRVCRLGSERWPKLDVV